MEFNGKQNSQRHSEQFEPIVKRDGRRTQYGLTEDSIHRDKVYRQGGS